MVWGCMSANGVGNMEFVEGIMDQYEYIRILRRNLKPSAATLGIEDNFIFQQDNDPKHKSHNAMMYIAYNTPEYVETPPQIPPCNSVNF